MITYLIDRILKEGLVNIIYGPSGASKTTWVLQELSALAGGSAFLGEFQPQSALPRTHYVALDRPTEELEDKLTHFGINTAGLFTYESLFSQLKVLNGVETVLAKVPAGTKLLVLDGVGFVIDGKKLIEQRSIGILMSECYKWCRLNQATMILIHHTAKSKVGAGYTNAREKAAGSGAWAQTAALSVLIQGTDDIESPVREAFVMQNGAAGFRLDLEMTEGGLVKATKLPTEQLEFNRSSLEKAFPEMSYPTLSRYIAEWIENGMFARTGNGKFRGCFPSSKPS